MHCPFELLLPSLFAFFQIQILHLLQHQSTLDDNNVDAEENADMNKLLLN